ncbi:MAG: AraC family transcriptional regulator [Planctomycetes bacterium]|nr:AraC family transcriptional regulator [Planctomycetota bacterium]
MTAAPTVSELRLDPRSLSCWLALGQAVRQPGQALRWTAASEPVRLDQEDAEQHHRIHLLLAVQGTVRIEGRMVAELRAGDALVMGPGTWHRHLPLDPGALCFEQGWLGGASVLTFSHAGGCITSSVPSQPSSALLEALAQAVDPPARHAALLALIEQDQRQDVAPLAPPDPRLLAMEMALWRHLHHAEVVERMIAASGLQRTRAYRLAQRHWGNGIAFAVRRARLQLADTLLALDLPVAEVARRCGFPSRRTFTRAYREFHGRPPSAAELGADAAD